VAEEAVRKAFKDQSYWCARMGSPFTARICALVGQRVDRTSAVGRRLLDWPGNPDGWADGLPLRLCGGLHALVRRGSLTSLASCYPPYPERGDETLWTGIAEGLEESALLPWLDHPPQTNEVGRGNGLMAGLLVVAATFGKPIRLYELGASAGLNLILDRYGFDLGGTGAGDLQSALKLTPEWTGPPPPAAHVDIIGRAGVDLDPVDPVGGRERLLAYVWADQRDRLAQLEKALAIAASDPPVIERGDAADWLERNLDVTSETGVARVVMHSVAYQYFPRKTQARIAARMEQAGREASPDAPLAWLRFEKDDGDKETTLRLRLWPGQDRLLAHCQPHGRAIHWLEG
jgi:hypothetical protein